MSIIGLVCSAIVLAIILAATLVVLASIRLGSTSEAYYDYTPVDSEAQEYYDMDH